MEVEKLVQIIGADFYTGVPDSQLKALCDYLINKYGVNGKHHIIGVNEGNCVALAAGYYLATGKIPVVYMQNSGEGNIINPVVSLLNNKVYGIPCIFIIGWRGEPGIKDEPQHIFQGEITVKLLKNMDIQQYIISKDTTELDINIIMEQFKKNLFKSKQVAFIVRKGALSYSNKIKYENKNTMSREEVISKIIDVSENDILVSTTGKASRELFEIRERNLQGHQRDFLTVGSMGYSSSIALGIALQKPRKRIWIIDGDGAALMHMGSMALLGANSPSNIVHIIINNGSHESVGGMPTVAEKINLVKIAEGCGYSNAVCVDSLEALVNELQKAKNFEGLSFIEAKCAIGARENLGRPTITTKENKEEFMKALL